MQRIRNENNTFVLTFSLTKLDSRKKCSCVCRSWEEISKAELFCTRLIQFLSRQGGSQKQLPSIPADNGLLYPEKEIKMGPWDLGNRRLRERRGSSLITWLVQSTENTKSSCNGRMEGLQRSATTYLKEVVFLR